MMLFGQYGESVSAFMTAKGALIVGQSLNTPTTLTVGADNTVLVADNAQATGVKWTSTLTNISLSGTITTTITASRAVVTDASSQLTQSASTSTQVGYLSGATGTTGTNALVFGTAPTISNISLSGTITTTITASRAVITNASSQITESATTSTELGYVSGVTSAIQTQMNLKAPLISPSFTTPALGTPTSGTLTNCTGLPISTGVSGLGTGVATFLATPSSDNLRTALTSSTGTGAAVFNQSPTFDISATSPILIGGTSASSSLTLKSTSGVGTSDSILFKVGNNGATLGQTIDTSGKTTFGATALTIGTLNVFGAADTNTILYMEKSGQVQMTMGMKSTAADTNFYVGTGSTTIGTYGVYLTNTGVVWVTTSDERKKVIIEPITDGLNKVNTLRSVIGRYKYDNESKRRVFLIAQDVQKVLPEAVEVNKDKDKTLGLGYTDVIPLLVSAIKELSQKNNELQLRVQNLENII